MTVYKVKKIRLDPLETLENINMTYLSAEKRCPGVDIHQFIPVVNTFKFTKFEVPISPPDVISIPKLSKRKISNMCESRIFDIREYDPPVCPRIQFQLVEEPPILEIPANNIQIEPLEKLTKETVGKLHTPVVFEPDFKVFEYTNFPTRSDSMIQRLEIINHNRKFHLELPIDFSCHPPSRLKKQGLIPLLNRTLPGLVNYYPLKAIANTPTHSVQIPLWIERAEKVNLRKFEIHYMEDKIYGKSTGILRITDKSSHDINLRIPQRNYEILDTKLFPNSSYMSWKISSCFNSKLDIAKEIPNRYLPKVISFSSRTTSSLDSYFENNKDPFNYTSLNHKTVSKEVVSMNNSVDVAVDRYFSLRGNTIITKPNNVNRKQISNPIPKKSLNPVHIYTSSKIIECYSKLFVQANIIAYERGSENIASIDSKACIIIMKLSDMFKDNRHRLLKAASKFCVIHVLLEFGSAFQDTDLKGVFPFTPPNNAMIRKTKGFIYGVLEQELGCTCSIWNCLNRVQVVDLISSLAKPGKLSMEESLPEMFLKEFPGMNIHLASTMLKDFSLKEICRMSLNTLKEKYVHISDNRRLVALS
ncbi:hypothetical protein HDV06_002693 [Boothiomyces sp. JEL0866]|nr:hypothetical protein HDV06_002693 [Boothiomyces sp. JEL0866]